MPSCRQKGAPRAEECRFIGRREQETGSYTRLVANCRVTFFYRRGGTSQTGNLTSADQEIPDWVVWGSISGRTETVQQFSLSLMTLGLKSTPFGSVFLLLTEGSKYRYIFKAKEVNIQSLNILLGDSVAEPVSEPTFASQSFSSERSQSFSQLIYKSHHWFSLSLS